MTDFLWTYIDIANLKIGYVYGVFSKKQLDERLEAMKANNYVSGELINSAPLPHRADALFNPTAEQDA